LDDDEDEEASKSAQAPLVDYDVTSEIEDELLAAVDA